jgi:uncharacterized cupin superfamily protein
MPKSIVIAASTMTDLDAAPIVPSWILSGAPEARNKLLANSEDRTTYIMAWECTPGRFDWHYTEDETLVIVSGEVFISNQAGQERRLGPGDMAFFPAGSSCTWRITEKVRKVAVVRSALPMPFALCLRVWNKMFQIMGLRPRSPMILPILTFPTGI